MDDIETSRDSEALCEIDLNFHRIQDNGITSIASNSGGPGFTINKSKVFYLKRNLFISNKVPRDMSEADISVKVSELIK